MALPYIKTVWNNGAAPALNAANLNKIEAGIDDCSAELVALPKITTSPIAGGPPAGPADGDIWVATDVDANGTRWQFQYDSSSPSAYKWAFIGGAPSVSEVAAFESGGSGGTPTDLATEGPWITLPRTGDYVVRYGCVANVTVSGQNALMSLFTGAGVRASGNEADVSTTGFTAASTEELLHDKDAGNYKAMYWAGGGATGTWANRVISFVPVRIA